MQTEAKQTKNMFPFLFGHTHYCAKRDPARISHESKGRQAARVHITSSAAAPLAGRTREHRENEGVSVCERGGRAKESKTQREGDWSPPQKASPLNDFPFHLPLAHSLLTPLTFIIAIADSLV